MLESLRVRLLLWYTAILALVMAAFGVAVCYAFWRSLLTDLDGELRGRALAVAAALRPAPGDRFDLDLSDDTLAFFQQDGTARPYYVIWGATGRLIDRSDPELDMPRPEAPAIRTRAAFRELAIPAAAGAVVLVGRSTSGLRSAVWSLAVSVGGAGALALGLSLLGGWFLTTRALAPIARISGTAERMARGDLAARIAVDRTETELEQVAAALNAAFDRLHEVVERQRRFTADASHELRTPLSIVRAETDWALARGRAPEEYRAALDTCRRAAGRMQALVEGLLTLARADASELPLARGRMPLAPVVEDAVSLLRPAADRRGITLAIGRDDQHVEIEGDEGRLREAITNLVSNAIRYNRDGGRVDVEVWGEDGAANIAVTDTGVGIPSEALPRIFDRFYRVDPSRTRDGGGVGLGLAVTKWIVESHGGEISCSSEESRGSRFVIRLPATKA